MLGLGHVAWYNPGLAWMTLDSSIILPAVKVVKVIILRSVVAEASRSSQAVLTALHHPLRLVRRMVPNIISVGFDYKRAMDRSPRTVGRLADPSRRTYHSSTSYGAQSISVIIPFS